MKVTRVAVKSRPTDLVWVVCSRNYRTKADGSRVLPQAKKDRALQVFADRDSAWDYVYSLSDVYDYQDVSASTPDDFLAKYF